MTSTASPSSSSCDSGPQLAEALDRELALLAALGVHEVLEAVHRDLAEDRRDRALDRLRPAATGATPASRRASSRRPNTSVSPNTRRGLGQRQRRRHVEDALRGAERRVHAVAELVRERQHVAALVACS